MAGLAEARGLATNRSLSSLVLRAEYSKGYFFSGFSGAEPLRILPFTELVPLMLGIVNAIRVDEHGYHVTQALASAVWGKWPEIDGISYASRMYPTSICYAIFDRAIPRRGLIVTSSTPILEDPSIQTALLQKKIIQENK